MKYAVTTPPTVELLTLTEVKDHVTPIDSSDDTYLTDCIKDAREYCEEKTGRALAAQTIKAYPDRFDCVMRLPREPINAVSSVKYTDYDGVVTTMPATNYAVDTIDGNIAFFELPDFEPTIINPIEITYTAGYTILPRTIRRAMLVIIGYWHENRGDKELPENVERKVLNMLNSKKVFFV